jgi:hypothetical protein
MVWIFRHSAGLDRRKAHEVEIRLDLPQDQIAQILDVPGWRVAQKRDDGKLFLRREQPLTNAALRRLFREALVLAHTRGGRFQSWMHKPDLTDWD